jgi:branched-chain amino acid transport system permease protein
MVDTFGEKDVIGGVLTQGQMLLLLIWFGFGYLVTRRVPGGTGSQTIGAGALVGAITSALLVVLLLLAEPLNLRVVLVEASPALVEDLTLGLGSGPGSLFLMIAGLALGALGAAVPGFPERVRRPLVMALAWVFAVGIFQDVLAPIPALPRVVASFMFDMSGLSLVGAVLIFVVVAGLTHFWSQRGARIRGRIDAMPSDRQKTARWIVLALGLVLVLILPQIVGSYLSDVLSTVGIYILMGLGLNIVVGYAGLLDLGYVAFFAIGAYTASVLTSTGELGFGLNFWLAVPFAVLAAALAGIILGVPVLQMRGDYLAIVTMGFGEIIRILVLSDALRPWLGGAQGILAVPKISVLGFRLSGPQQLLYLIAIAGLLAVFISRRLSDSRIGRAWMAIREDEDVAEAVGIGLVKHKLMAFAAGAAFAGLAGAIFASKLGSIYPHSFKLEVSIWVLCLLIVGGMGSIPGVAVGALVMMGLPEVLRTFAEYRLLFYGAILVVMMLSRPEGLWPEESRRRELHADEENDIDLPPDVAPAAGTES